MYKLAIFDFDGTLVNSTPGIIDTMRLVKDFYGFDDNLVERWSHMIGISLRDQTKMLLPDAKPEFQLEVAEKYREFYNLNFLELCPPFEDLEHMLAELNSKDIKVTIASSKKSYLIEEVLAHLKMESCFKMVIGHDRVLNHKPHPESVSVTMKGLGHVEAETVVIGDSIYDLEMAKNAGVDAIGVATGIHDRDHLAKAQPVSVVNSLLEVLEVILKGKN